MASRLSREKAVYCGSLKGMPLKSYQFVQKMHVKQVMNLAQRYVSSSLWTKFDRGKPLSIKQATEIEAAINQALRQNTPDFPINTPFMKLNSIPVKGYKFKRIYSAANLILTTLESISTSEGQAFYLNKRDQYEYQTQRGPMAWSRHAIERLLERCPALDQYSYRQTTAVIAFLYAVASAERFGECAGTMVSAYPHGFFPVKFSRGFWVCTSFLTPDMKGTPNDTEPFNHKWEHFPEDSTVLAMR